MEMHNDTTGSSTAYSSSLTIALDDGTELNGDTATPTWFDARTVTSAARTAHARQSLGGGALRIRVFSCCSC